MFHLQLHRSARMTVFAAVLACLAASAAAQTVSHPLSEITSAIHRYTWEYRMSPTEKKTIEYIIVRASNGDVKTVFNACDVCYPYHKGYSQSGTDLRCNNCGNRFAVDGLGNRSTGTCNPGYLPHTVSGDSVMIETKDLAAGAYFFATQTVSGADDRLGAPAVLSVVSAGRMLTVTLPGDAPRTFRLFSIAGRLVYETSRASGVVRIDVGGLAAGAYLLAVQEGRALSTRPVIVY